MLSYIGLLTWKLQRKKTVYLDFRQSDMQLHYSTRLQRTDIVLQMENLEAALRPPTNEPSFYTAVEKTQINMPDRLEKLLLTERSQQRRIQYPMGTASTLPRIPVEMSKNGRRKDALATRRRPRLTSW